MQLNKRYNFTTIAPSLLGAYFYNMKLIGITQLHELNNANDMATLHEQIRTTEGLLHDIPVEQLSFHSFRDVNDEKVTLALEWIDSDSIQETNVMNVNFNVLDIGPDDKVKISQVLKELGYHNVEVRESYV